MTRETSTSHDAQVVSLEDYLDASDKEQYLQPGVLISGFNNFKQMSNLFTDFSRYLAGLQIKQYGLRSNNFHNALSSYRLSLDKILSEEAKKDHFNGALKPAGLLILPPNLNLAQKNRKLTKYGKENPLDEKNILSFLVICEMISTGRGEIGLFEKECAMYTEVYKFIQLGQYKISQPSVSLEINPANSARTKEEISYLISESRAAWAGQLASNLKYAASGGLVRPR